MTIENGVPVVMAEVAGMSGRFIVDTGAAYTVVDTAWPGSAPLARGAQTVNAQGAAGDAPSVKLSSGVVALPNIAGRRPPVPVLLMSLKGPNARFNTPAAGIVSPTALNPQAVLFDYASGRISLGSAATKAAHGGTPLPLEMRANLPVIAVSITCPDGKSITANLVVDTGAGRATVVFARKFADDNKLRDAKRRIEGAAGVGLTGRLSIGDVVRLPRVKAGDIDMVNVPVLLSRDTEGVFAGGIVDGIIGAAALSHGQVLMDYAGKQVTFGGLRKPLANLPYRDHAGMELDFTDARFTVIHVSDGGPADTAGIKIGDRIVTIGRDAIASLGPVAVSARFTRSGPLPVTVLRGSETLHLTLQQKTLI